MGTPRVELETSLEGIYIYRELQLEQFEDPSSALCH